MDEEQKEPRKLADAPWYVTRHSPHWTLMKKDLLIVRNDDFGDIAIVIGERNANLIASTRKILEALETGQSKSWVCNAAITNDIEALRQIALEHADWWNKIAYPLIAKAKAA